MRKFLLVFGVMCVIGAVPLFAQDAETGEAEKEPIWKGSLGLSWVATTGNTDTSSFGLDFGLDRKPDPWGLSFVVRRSLAKRWEVFGGLAWAKDPFAGFDSQTVASVGGTYIAIESQRHLLTFDLGLAYTWEARVPPAEDVDFIGGLFGVNWEWALSENSKLTEHLVFLPNFDNSDDWRLNSVTSLEAAVNSWLALRLGYEVRYRNQPIDNADSTDTTSTASVVFKF